MTETSPPAVLDRARRSAERGDWRQAYEVLVDADQRGHLGGPALALLADVAYAVGRPDVTIATWERAHAMALRAGDSFAAGAAAVRVAMHLLLDTGLMAPVRGWIKRAEDLLEGHDESAALAWLSVVRNYERMLSGDFATARRWARHAVEVGTRCDPAPAAVGRVAVARALILQGEVSDGLGLLNDAAVSTVSGELDPISTGIVYCEVVCAFQALAQYDLAEEWTAAMDGWRHGRPVGSIHGRCRVHRAEILRLRGSSEDAEREVLNAYEELRPYLGRELGWPLTELGKIRLRRGDLDGAEQAFLEAHEIGWDPQPGLALVYLAKGDGPSAVRSIRDALEHPLHVPSKELPPNSDLRRAPLLEAQTEIEVAAGDVEVARAAAEELVGIAELFQSKGLIAGATVASARVSLAEGDVEGARRGLERAIGLWSEIGAPYETARARMELAKAYHTAGAGHRAILELEAARSTFERIGASALLEEAAFLWGGAVGRDEVSGEGVLVPRADAVEGAGGSGANVFRRAGDYWSVVFEGRTTRLRDLKGLWYLSRLLAEPGREFHVLDLVTERPNRRSGGVGEPAERTPLPDSDCGPLLDSRAKEAYRRRLTEIDEDIAEARALGDDERAAQAEAERDFISRELAQAFGLGGRDRLAGSAAERARSSVTRAIRRALARIQGYDPGLGEHLEHAIQTGTYCAYRADPASPRTWKV